MEIDSLNYMPNTSLDPYAPKFVPYITTLQNEQDTAPAYGYNECYMDPNYQHLTPEFVNPPPIITEQQAPDNSGTEMNYSSEPPIEPLDMPTSNDTDVMVTHSHFHPRRCYNCGNPNHTLRNCFVRTAQRPFNPRPTYQRLYSQPYHQPYFQQQINYSRQRQPRSSLFTAPQRFTNPRYFRNHHQTTYQPRQPHFPPRQSPQQPHMTHINR